MILHLSPALRQHRAAHPRRCTGRSVSARRSARRLRIAGTTPPFLRQPPPPWSLGLVIGTLCLALGYHRSHREVRRPRPGFRFRLPWFVRCRRCPATFPWFRVRRRRPGMKAPLPCLCRGHVPRPSQRMASLPPSPDSWPSVPVVVPPAASARPSAAAGEQRIRIGELTVSARQTVGPDANVERVGADLYRETRTGFTRFPRLPEILGVRWRARHGGQSPSPSSRARWMPCALRFRRCTLPGC